MEIGELRNRLRKISTVLFALIILATVIFAVILTVEEVQIPSTNDLFGDSMDLFMLVVMIPVVIVELDCCVCVRYFLQSRKNMVLYKTIINGIIGAFHIFILIYAAVEIRAMIGSLFMYSPSWFPVWLILRLVYIGLKK